MHRHELTPEDAARIAAGACRNHLSAPGPIFSPWAHLLLTWRDGTLYRASAPHNDGQRDYTPLLTAEELLNMSDEAILQRLEGTG